MRRKKVLSSKECEKLIELLHKAEEAKRRKARKELIKAIPEWSDEYYEELMQYAVRGGFDERAVRNSTNVASFKMLHKAFQFDRLHKPSTAKRHRALRVKRRLVS